MTGNKEGAVDGITPDVNTMKFRSQSIATTINDVVPGIRFQGQLIANGTYKIMKQCVNSIKEYSTYLWDERASKLGIDKPIKQNDHCCDAQRYALYSHFFDRLQGTMTEKDAMAMEAAYGRKYY